MAAINKTWVQYIETKYGVSLSVREDAAAVDVLKATQSEIEQVKYLLVRDEAFRVNQPILVYQTMMGGEYVIDGHTRARVAWETGSSTVKAIICHSREIEIDAEVTRMANVAGGGREIAVSTMPIVDRLGEGTPAWHRRRQELLAKAHRENNSPPTASR